MTSLDSNDPRAMDLPGSRLGGAGVIRRCSDRPALLALLGLRALDGFGETSFDRLRHVGGLHYRVAALTESEEGTYRVREERLPEVRDGLAALVRRAARLGVPAPTIEEVAIEEVEEVATIGLAYAWTGQVQRTYVLRPSVAPVRLAGWSFVATIQHLGEDGNIVRTQPGFGGDLPVHFRSDRPTCDHCKTYRRRLDTFVLQHEDGRFSRIGRNCLVDFLGDSNAARVVEHATWDLSFLDGAEDDGEGSYGSGGAKRYSPLQFLAVVALFIRKLGWLSRSVASKTFGEKTATVDSVISAYHPSPKYDGIRVEEVEDCDREQARLALDWAQAINPETDSDYLHNVRVVAGLPSWTYRELGLAASIVSGYLREQDRLNRLTWERKLPSTFVGTVGQRFGGKGKGSLPALTATVLGLHRIEGDYGVTTIIRFQAKAADGATVHDLVWFASGSELRATSDDGTLAKAVTVAERAYNALTRDDCEARWSEAGRTAYALVDEAREAFARSTRDVVVGDVVELTGTVKKQEVSRKTTRPETVLSRCSLRLVADEPTASK